ncbi:hypothetical protein EYF80_055967 [Liparis tanakae]|uniref:Uncharacterized protein n=1 Tax=Liparis tanakae TaxID=230148 RepID=A0A4Z2EZQ5_9TELE|nr:hypothetical protein EYF80_055967 [Liparis tanakae]
MFTRKERPSVRRALQPEQSGVEATPRCTANGREHFISLHLTSSHFISLHLTSSHFISLHLVRWREPQTE